MKGFTNKSIISSSPRQSGSGLFKSIGVVIGLIAIVTLMWWGLGQGKGRFQSQLKSIIANGIGIIGGQVGDSIEEDDMGQITALIVGVGGQGHRGGYNTDTMMVASYSPHNKAITFISVPRDLYISFGTGRAGRINAFLNQSMAQGESLTGALSELTQKVSSIVGVTINHYVLVDFKGFEDMIDTLGGIEVTVPKTIIDYTYPADEDRTMVLTINSGHQIMNGDLALKYARSRHSTSDFDRSLRQQQIIQGVVKKLIVGGGILKLNELRQQLEQTIVTDLSFSQIIGLSKYLNRVNHYFSFVLQSDCGTHYTIAKTGCLLYAPARENFGGAAVLLPQGASASRLSYYDKIQQFAYYTVYQQDYLIEGARVVILNGIDKDQLLAGENPNGITSNLASDLITYGFTVEGIGNSTDKTLSSTLYKVGSGEYDTTVQLLKEFSPFVYDQQSSLMSISGTIFSGNNELPLYFSGVDLILVIGNDYFHKSTN